MVSKQVTFTLHGVDDPIVVADIDATKMYGTAALNQFLAYKTVKAVVVSNNTETVTYIPFHAIITVAVEEETVEPSKPVEDEFCPSSSDGE